ncbi:MAG TPA: hypothetical protein VFN61_04475 [Acidimicrobiales bacterium]|nr:hypothetical protein [Acidimicrobiales bacterium]
MSDFDVSVSAPVRETALPQAGAELAAPPGPGVTPDEVVPNVDEATVRSLLSGLGMVLSTVDRAPGVPGLWRWQPDELDQIVPPLTRAANRSPALRKALIKGDVIAISLALSTYGARNVGARTEALKRAKQQAKNDGTGGGGEQRPDGDGQLHGRADVGAANSAGRAVVAPVHGGQFR